MKQANAEKLNIYNEKNSGVLQALHKVQAIIEFNLDGTVITANENFCKTFGYSLEEIQGKHHKIFCEEQTVNSIQYKKFWEKLNYGEFDKGEYCRLTKDGKEVWINASYNPVFDDDGNLLKIVKFATDITESKAQLAEFNGKIEAIKKSQAVIEFNLDGTVITANDNFCNAVGYSLEEIQGKHHSLFCEKEYTSSAEYLKFWQKLNAGVFDSGKYKRKTKTGQDIWIQASYNPIFNAKGVVYKVVKFAADITAQVELENKVKTKTLNDQRKVDDLLISVNQAAAGNLTTEIKVEGTEEALDQLSAGLKTMFSELRGIIKQVASSSQKVDNSAGDITEKSSSVASGTQTLGATVEEMNASVEELTASISLIAENSKGASKVAQETQKEAEIGGVAVNKLMAAMELINKSSKDVSEIIKTISEISSQTNMLAFNAAIEAARAGEHGLGFSVVADEVRKLAERSNQAAKEISKLISESIERAAAGSEISKQAGEAFSKISTGVAKTNQSISEISCAADEQSTAAKEVSSAIAQIAEETEKTAVASDNIALKCKEMSGEADELNEIVKKFVV